MKGFGGMISFEVKGGTKAGKKVAESVKLITLAVSLGGVYLPSFIPYIPCDI